MIIRVKKCLKPIDFDFGSAAVAETDEIEGEAAEVKNEDEVEGSEEASEADHGPSIIELGGLVRNPIGEEDHVVCDETNTQLVDNDDAVLEAGVEGLSVA